MKKPINTTPKFHRHFTEFPISELMRVYVQSDDRYAQITDIDRLLEIFSHLEANINDTDKLTRIASARHRALTRI